MSRAVPEEKSSNHPSTQNAGTWIRERSGLRSRQYSSSSGWSSHSTNQGGGSGAKNWQYWVNTTYADRSFAVFEVQALDTVFWRFAGGGK